MALTEEEINNLELTRESALNVANNAAVKDKISFLKRLREGLNKGDVSISDFSGFGKELADRVNRDLFQLGGSGRDAANLASQLLPKLQETGFAQNQANPREINIVLPESFQERVRNELIPDNIKGKEREELLKDIPFDIDVNSDRFAIEREAIRQKIQAKEEAEVAKRERSSRLDELRELLNTQGERTFKENNPLILEELNKRGQLDSSEVGNALARELARQKSISNEIVSAQSISDRDVDINASLDIGAATRGFQTEGLSRKFSLDDFNRNQLLSERLAALSKPQPKGKTGGEKAVQGIEAGAAVIESIGSIIGGGK